DVYGISSLLILILGLLMPMLGEIKLFGVQAIHLKHPEWLGNVSQKSNAFISGFPATIEEVVKSGLSQKVGLFKRYPKDADFLVKGALKDVGMEKFLKRNIGQIGRAHV